MRMRHYLTISLLIILTACATDPFEDDSATAEQLYSSARESLVDGNYSRSIKQFEELQARFPYGSYAQQAQIEVAYAYYKEGESESALSTIDRFEKTYPNSPNLDYMLYLKGLVTFTKSRGMLDNILKLNPAERDPGGLNQSFDAFKDLVEKYPFSRYSDDARLRMQYLRNTLADSDIQIASYYLRRGAYIAAANRAKNVVNNFPQAPQSRDALQIMVQAYDAMGLADLRDDTQKILEINLSDSEARPMEHRTADDKSWWQFWK